MADEVSYRGRQPVAHRDDAGIDHWRKACSYRHGAMMIVQSHAELGSTNDEALRLAAQGAAHGTVVTAARQTSGRGRQGRSWASPVGNLHASFVLRPAVAPLAWVQTGFVAALAVASTLDAFAPGSTLKWPNDVMLRDAKIAGILAEMAGTAVIVGVGINVANTPPDMPYPVTSLAREGAAVTAHSVLTMLIIQFEHWLATWTQDGFVPIRATWLTRGPAIGQPMRARIGLVQRSGSFAGMAEDGALLLDTETGRCRIVAGEVVADAG